MLHVVKLTSGEISRQGEFFWDRRTFPENWIFPTQGEMDIMTLLHILNAFIL